MRFKSITFGSYLSIQPHDTYGDVYMSGVAGDLESWTLEEFSDGVFYLKSFSGNYLGMEERTCRQWRNGWWSYYTCYYAVLKPSVFSEEVFEIRRDPGILDPTNGLMIYNRKWDRYVSARGLPGTDVTGMPAGPWEVFKPELVA